MDKGRKLALTTAIFYANIGLCLSILDFLWKYIFDNLGEEKVLLTAASLPVGGFILGLIVAPAQEPQSFNNPIAWQVFPSIIGGLFFAYAVEANTFGYLLSVIISGYIGYTAKSWAEHLPVIPQ